MDFPAEFLCCREPHDERDDRNDTSELEWYDSASEDYSEDNSAHVGAVSGISIEDAYNLKAVKNKERNDQHDQDGDPGANLCKLR